MLGLTVDLDVLAHANVWLVGVAIAAVLILLIRPLLVGVILLPFGLARNETLFVLWSGLKGAVPLLLGTLVLGEHVPEAERVYGIVIVVVMVSVVVQGTLVQTSIAARLKIPCGCASQSRGRSEYGCATSPTGYTGWWCGPGLRGRCHDPSLPVSSDDVWVSFVVRASSWWR